MILGKVADSPETTGSRPRSGRLWRRGRPSRPPRKVGILAAVVALLLAVSAGVLWAGRSGPPTSRSPTAEGYPVGEDALQRRVLAELTEFTEWLKANGVDGYIGEVGIPDDGDGRWLELADKWFQVADDDRLWVDAWSVGEWWPKDYPYSPFVTRGDGGPIAVERPTGALLTEQAKRSDEPRGVNVSGGEFGAVGGMDNVSDFSNKNPGTYGEDYQYASRSTYDFLASRGLDTVRLPFRWERIQPELGAPLDPAELERLRTTVGQATAAGLEVILDVQNFGAYMLDDGGSGVRRAIGSEQVSRADFADLWSRLSAAFADVPGVVAYDLMNEPVNLPSVDGMTGAQLWEAASQDALTAIRDRGDDKLIMVPGYNWSHPGGWTQQHPRAWIDDPAGNIRYTAHHYWQQSYDHSYDSEVARATASGF